jgi:hypothetical protein
MTKPIFPYNNKKNYDIKKNKLLGGLCAKKRSQTKGFIGVPYSILSFTVMLVDIGQKPTAINQSFHPPRSTSGQSDRRTVYPVKLRPNCLVEVKKDQNWTILCGVDISGENRLGRRGRGGGGIHRFHDQRSRH